MLIFWNFPHESRRVQKRFSHFLARDIKRPNYEIRHIVSQQNFACKIR